MHYKTGHLFRRTQAGTVYVATKLNSVQVFSDVLPWTQTSTGLPQGVHIT